MKKGDKVISPVRVRRKFTKGKEYEILRCHPDYSIFEIRDDSGAIIYCTLENCYHIGFKNWKLKKEG